MAGTQGHSGGARPGSGRKRKSRGERLEPTRLKLDKYLQKNMVTRVTAVEQLAGGGLQTITERWELAGTLLIETTEDVPDAHGAHTGKTVTRRVRALPDTPANELVLAGRTIKTHAPNLAANVYLVNRLVGTPAPIAEQAEQAEHDDVAEPNALPAELDAIVKRIYGASPTPDVGR